MMLMLHLVLLLKTSMSALYGCQSDMITFKLGVPELIQAEIIPLEPETG